MTSKRSRKPFQNSASARWRLGVTIAPHPHIWGPIERPEGSSRPSRSDRPRYRVLDSRHRTAQPRRRRSRSAHRRLLRPTGRRSTGRIRRRRIAVILAPTPTKEMHAEEILYKDLGSGGVDHPAIWAMLNERGYDGWVTLDLDPPRPNEGEGSVDDKMGINCRYLSGNIESFPPLACQSRQG